MTEEERSALKVGDLVRYFGGTRLCIVVRPPKGGQWLWLEELADPGHSWPTAMLDQYMVVGDMTEDEKQALIMKYNLGRDE